MWLLVSIATEVLTRLARSPRDSESLFVRGSGSDRYPIPLDWTPGALPRTRDFAPARRLDANPLRASGNTKTPGGCPCWGLKLTSMYHFLDTGSISSPRETLFVTTSLFTKAVSRWGDESWQFRVPLGGFQVETGSNTVVRLLTHRRVQPTGRAAGGSGCCRHAGTSPDRRALGQPRAAIAHMASLFLAAW
jgi:hypothetical protein